jgi:hypothetical protein
MFAGSTSSLSATRFQFLSSLCFQISLFHHFNVIYSSGTLQTAQASLHDKHFAPKKKKDPSTFWESSVRLDTIIMPFITEPVPEAPISAPPPASTTSASVAERDFSLYVASSRDITDPEPTAADAPPKKTREELLAMMRARVEKLQVEHPEAELASKGEFWVPGIDFSTACEVCYLL